MQVLVSPQRSDDVIEYQFSGEKITAATVNGQSDVFDFSTLPDGKAEEITTILSVNPIVSAKRVDGVLFVELLNFIGANATEEERFPKWQEV
jgi:hypothetical protein